MSRLCRLPAKVAVPPLLAVLLAVGGLVFAAPATPASASPTCYADACLGHDPNLYGCTVSSQKYAYYYSGRTLMATLTNKYSIKCDANWAQAQLSPYAASLGWNFLVGIDTVPHPPEIQLTCYDGPNSLNNTGASEPCPNQNNPPYRDSWSSPTWTDMVNGTTVTWSWMWVVDANGNDIVELTANQ